MKPTLFALVAASVVSAAFPAHAVEPTFKFMVPVRTLAVQLATAQMDPGNLDFGSATVGSTTLAKVVTLTNPKSTAVAVSNLNIEGDSFLHTHDCPTSMPAQSSCSISVAMKPTAAGPLSGALSTVIEGKTLKTVLTGTGQSPLVEVRTGGKIVSQHSFGTLGAGTSSDTVIFNIKNITTSPIALGPSRAYVDVPFSRVSSGCGASIAVNSSCNVSVSFAPQAEQSYTGNLRIDFSGVPVYTAVTLSGTGVGQPISGFNSYALKGLTSPPSNWLLKSDKVLIVGSGFNIWAAPSLSDTFTKKVTVTGAVGNIVDIQEVAGKTVVKEDSPARLSTYPTITPEGSVSSSAQSAAGSGGNGGMLATNGSVVLATAETGYMRYTADGTTWQQIGNPPFFDRVTYANGIWMVGASSQSQVYGITYNAVYTSTDLVNWTQRVLPVASSHNPKSIHYADGTWYVGTSGGQIVSSKNLTSWTPSNTPFSAGTIAPITGIAVGPKGLVAISPRGIITSIDGVKWASIAGPWTGSASRVAYFNGKFHLLSSNEPSYAVSY